MIPLRLWAANSEATGTATRQGVGKIWHLHIRTLWVQQAASTGRVDLRNTKRTENPAGMLTKHVPPEEELEQIMKLFGC